MARRVQWRRGTSAQHGSFTGALAEITVDTDRGWVRVHDGSVPGGSVINPVFDPRWFGARGEGDDDAPAFQAMFDAIGDAGAGRILVPAPPSGSYRFGSTVTPPEDFTTSWSMEGESGGAGTGVKFAALESSPAIALFHINDAIGPLKVFRGIRFEGPGGGAGAGSGAGVRVTGSNGVLFENCWFNGINRGVDHVSGSFVSGINCAFEYCNCGIYAAANMLQSQWHITTYYRNVVDIRLTGDNKTFAHVGSSHIAAQTTCIDLVDCNHAQFSDASFCDDSSGYTPVLVKLSGATGCKRNKVAGITASGIGSRVISLEGAGTQFNDISGVMIDAVPTGILVASASRNIIRGLHIKGCTTRGIDIDTAPNNQISDFVIEGCDVGIRVFAAAGNSFSEGAILTSGTADWDVASTGTIWVRGVEADYSGLVPGTDVALLGFRVGNGRVEGFAAAAPGTIGYTFLVGDKIWKTDVAANGSPGWVCTTGGDPATWKAMPAVAA